MKHFACLSFLLLIGSACHPGLGATRAETAAPAQKRGLRMPPPTEHILDDDAESVGKALRKAWFAERHKAPPGVDWQAIERANGLAQTEKRNRMGSLAGLKNWVERGSENQAGRMHVACPSTDGSILYAGSSKGGVWKGEAGNWTPIGDNLFGGAHWLGCVPGANPGDPDVVLAATDGGLIHVTRNDGVTWELPSGLDNTVAVRRLLVTTDGTFTIYMLVHKGSGANRKYRLFRSTDAAASFQRIFVLDGYPGDAWVSRRGGSDLYLMAGDALHVSTDQGDNWTQVAALGLGSTEAELAGSEAGAPRFYAILKVGGQEKLYRSDDAGANWTFKTDVSDYWGSMNASTVDADLFAWGGVEVHRTRNGGDGFSIVNAWGEYYGDPANKLHADIPGLDVIPAGASAETWYVATDGGLYGSSDGLSSVQNLGLTGLRVSQYYSTLTSNTDPNVIAAGSQDQGFQLTKQAPSAGTRHEFVQEISGDYGHLTSGDGAHNWIFSTYPGFILVTRGATPQTQLYLLDFPPDETNAWMPPVIADPADRRDFFFCATRIYRYDKTGGETVWNHSLWSTFDFGQSAGEYISALSFSEVDPQKAYAVTNYGRLFHSEDTGVTWTGSPDLGPSGQYFYGTALLADSNDADTAYVGGSGYGVPAIYRTTDGGQNWDVFDEGLPDTLVYCLGEAPDGNGSLFCGTESSVFRRDAGATEWVDVTGNSAPVTTYWSVEALAHENSLRFGTYGRGIWDYRLDPPGEIALYGCGLNPAGSLVVSGVPAPGETLLFEVDNPVGSQAPGAIGLVQLALAPAGNYPCGTSLPGFGMDGPGELLLSLPSRLKPVLVGTPWGGPGLAAQVSLALPNDPALLGVTLYAQGILFDPTPGADPRFGLAEAAAIVIGNAP